MQVTYLETGSQNPFYNLAFEEYVLTHRRTGEIGRASCRERVSLQV